MWARRAAVLAWVVASIGACAEPPSAVQTLESEVRSLQGTAASLLKDKQALLRTVSQMLRTNQTQLLEHQMADLVHLKASVEERCAKERVDLEGRAKKAEEAADAAQEAVKELREQNANLQVAAQRLQAEVEQLRRRSEALVSDKQHLMEALRGFLRNSTRYGPSVVARRTAERNLKQPPANSSHVPDHQLGHRGAKRGKPSYEEDPTAYMADTRAITSYVVRAGSTDAMAEEEVAFMRAAASTAVPHNAVKEDLPHVLRPVAQMQPTAPSKLPPAKAKVKLREVRTTPAGLPATLPGTLLSYLKRPVPTPGLAASASSPKAVLDDDGDNGVAALLRQADQELGSVSPRSPADRPDP